MACLLCGDARAETQPVGKATVSAVECTLCGRYEMSWALSQSIERNRDQFGDSLKFLTVHTRQASEAGNLVRLTTENHTALAAGHRRTPVATKLRRVLDYFAHHSRFAGDALTIPTNAHPLFDSVHPDEVTYLVHTLKDRGDIVLNAARDGWLVTAKGWDRIQPNAAGGVPGAVFVAMAFNDDMQAVFDDGIEPAIATDCLLTLMQVSRVEHNESITDVIMAGIRAAQVVVADVTHHRNGVYFEGGFGMGLGRVVVWMCRDTDFDRVHFDTSHYNHIVWTDAADLRRKLAARLRATISVPANNS